MKGAVPAFPFKERQHYEYVLPLFYYSPSLPIAIKKRK